MSVRKRVLIFLLGQSNEAGTCKLSDGITACANYKPIDGPPFSAETPPKTGRGMWVYMAESLWKRRKIWCEVRNTARGGTGVVLDWCGTDDGTYTGNVRAYTDGIGGANGWDPNGYFGDSTASGDSVDIVSQMTARENAGFDERWLFISIGQNDSGSVTSAAAQAKWEQGLVNAIEWAKSKSLKAALGFTCYSVLNQDNYDNYMIPGINNVLSLYANDIDVIAGANLATRLGKNIELFDDYHMTQSSHERAGVAWADALISAGW